MGDGAGWRGLEEHSMEPALMGAVLVAIMIVLNLTVSLLNISRFWRFICFLTKLKKCHDRCYLF